MPGKLGARKDSKWMAICTEPSIDYTWFGPFRIPIPYTVTADLSKAMGTSPNVKFNGNPAYLLDQSKELKCIGDENGGGGGIHSGINLGEVKPVSGSKTVKINGKSVVREGDLCTMNKENCRGKYVTVPAPLPASVPPPEEVWVDIRLEQECPCPKHLVAIEAIATPAGGEFEWMHSHNCRLVDASGKPSRTGKKLWLKVLDDSEQSDPETEVNITVTYHHGDKHVQSDKSYRIHNDLPLSIKWKILTGKMAGALSDKRPEKPVNFKMQPFALVIIPRLEASDRERAEIQEACHYTFQTRESAVLDESVAVEASDAILQALKQKGEVYVIAHNDGVDTFAEAMSIVKARIPPEKIRKIHFQGFGSATSVTTFEYGLGSAHNVRNSGDPEAMGAFQVAHATACEIVNDRIPFDKWIGCRSDHPPLVQHNFIENYWGYVRTPSRGAGAPDTQHMRVSEPKQMAKHIAVAKALAKSWAHGDGFMVAGSGNAAAVIQEPEKKPIKAAIACFIDGTGNNFTGRSNIRLMYEEVLFNANNEDSEYVVYPEYLAGPGANMLDVFGKGTGDTFSLLGKDSMEIATEAYDRIVNHYSILKQDGVEEIKIDIYGFSRGAAIANELAWIIHDKGIQEEGETIASPKSVKVRFLGLFDTVHSMGMPGPNTSKKWHNDHIASIVENCAHAFAAAETRVYFEPSILARRNGKEGSDIAQMIFPGHHSDVGGHWQNNQNIMKITRSWISEHAAKAGASYLKSFILTEVDVEAIKSDRKKLEPGGMGFPSPEFFFGQNPLSWPHQIDKVLEESPLLPIPYVRDVQILARKFDAPLKEQAEEMHRDREFNRRIPRFIKVD